ncbi:TrmH family RNA methyltransferase [Nocardioides jishulii]|uniref:RNA methyltransferase n=1 Tax=Nocardioides jishulii TaxID=2575440 RepID=A0A4U2YPP4_9ACTN|nr:RNA methyltransferase [Nocardioides jishulii]QCX27324.1 RNA methyltransferase [Nocardioides jishulii]TKI61811.1 RNA methyltransferase [Nocardioides jishulii]
MNTPLSHANSRVKEARKLSRRSVRTERRLFLADGPKAVEGALTVPGCVVEVFATVAAAEQYAALLVDVPQLWLVEDRAMDSLSDSVSPAGVVAVCRFLDVDLADVLSSSPRLVTVCADVRDPGNAGTVIRTSDAAGAQAVVLAGHSVDPYNPKTVRASVGSLFHLPVVLVDDPGQVVRALQEAGLTVLAADGAGEVDLFDADLAPATAWLFGNEAWGLPDELAALADHRVSIPIHGSAESLNLATAAAVCLYASARAQR